MKKIYSTPIAEIIKFKTEDIIVTSLGDNNANVGGGWGDEDLG